MSDSLKAKIDYETDFTTAVASVLQALADSVSDNWRVLCDEWSSAEAAPKVDVDAWAAQCAAGKMERFQSNDGAVFYAAMMDFAFSPASSLLCSCVVLQRADGGLSVSLLLDRNAPGETVGDREQRRMEAPWEEARLHRTVRTDRSIGPDEDDPTFDAWWEKWDALEDTPPVWPQNKKAIQNIISRLAAVHPLRFASIDPELQT
ncbi:MAG TPA: hypothetical protein VGR35_16680 [Tepidisphaeraceae bacterium]|nr:hypothetical protein [Tepidisphaeraceae bacterium]